MEKTETEGGRSMLRLVRFMLFYGLAVAMLLWLLPMAGLFLEHQYEAMTSMAKVLAMLGLFGTVAAWQWHNVRQRWRQAALTDRRR